MNYWQTIVETNTLNFAILFVIFAVLFVKFNVKEVLVKIRDDVTSLLNSANEKREGAKTNLNSALEMDKNTDNEIAQSINRTKINTANIVGQIELDAQTQIQSLKNNIDSLIKFEDKQLSNELIQETITKAINLAKENIIKQLDDKKQEELILKSIEELDNIC